MMTDLPLTVSTSGRGGRSKSWQLGDVDGDAPRLVAGQQLGDGGPDHAFADQLAGISAAGAVED